MSFFSSIPSAPAGCFWELTRACEYRCLHCRADGPESIDGELKLDEALQVARQIAGLGIRRVVLTGGEPLQYEGWDEIAGELARAGVTLRLFTSGALLGEAALKRALEVGISEFAVSLDGPTEIHNVLRSTAAEVGARSPFDEACDALSLLVKHKCQIRVVTQVNRMNADSLFQTYQIVKRLGITNWQVHLYQAVGRGGRYREELLPDGTALEKIVRVLLIAGQEREVVAPLHCTVGYMTAEEPVLRGRESAGGRPVWQGCEAGRQTIAITANGGVKGCTALPDEFVVASLKERTLLDIWADNGCFPCTRQWTKETLAGACERCEFGTLCRAGCPAVAYGATGTIGANPYCLKLVRK